MGAAYQKYIGQPVGKAVRKVENMVGINTDLGKTQTVQSANDAGLAASSAEKDALLQKMSDQQETSSQLTARRKRGRASTMLTAESATGTTTAKTLLGG